MNSCTLLGKQNCKERVLQELEQVVLCSELFFFLICPCLPVACSWHDHICSVCKCNPKDDILSLLSLFLSFLDAIKIKKNKKKKHRADSMTVKLSIQTCFTLYSIPSLTEQCICSKCTHSCTLSFLICNWILLFM